VAFKIDCDSKTRHSECYLERYCCCSDHESRHSRTFTTLHCIRQWI